VRSTHGHGDAGSCNPPGPFAITSQVRPGFQPLAEAMNAVGQRGAFDVEHRCRARLVAAGGAERGADDLGFDLAQPIVERRTRGWRRADALPGEEAIAAEQLGRHLDRQPFELREQLGREAAFGSEPP